MPGRPSESQPRPQRQVQAQKEQEKCGSPFDTWLSNLKKRVEKRVAKMEGRDQETLVEKRVSSAPNLPTFLPFSFPYAIPPIPNLLNFA